MTRRIDAHQHYWEPKRGDYDWMPQDDPILARRYQPRDLEPTLKKHGIDQTVLVQAAATLQETEYLLGIADASDSVAAVVGWIDFEDRAHLRHLTRLAQHPKFVGVRPMIQDIPDLDWMLRDDVQWGFEALIELDLTLDALGYPQHLDNFHKLITRYRDLRVVVDHCMKPRIRGHAESEKIFADWAAGMTRLAEVTQSFCKFSGLVTEANEGWTHEDLRPYAMHVLEAFGPERVLWGSDWPVCRLRAEYDEWLATAKGLAGGLTAEQQDQVFGGSAIRFYRLDV